MQENQQSDGENMCGLFILARISNAGYAKKDERTKKADAIFISRIAAA